MAKTTVAKDEVAVIAGKDLVILIPQDAEHNMSEDQIALFGAFLLLSDDQDFYEKCAAHARTMASIVAGEYPSGELH